MNRNTTLLATLLLVAPLFAPACGGGDDNGQAQACDDLRSLSGGTSCNSPEDCPELDCPCTDGTTVSTRTCTNGACAGPESCRDACRTAGGLACDLSPNDNGETADTGGDDQDAGGPDPPMCDADLAPLADTEWNPDVECLERNCCDAAAKCANNQACVDYHDCTFDCFEGGQYDEACIQSCQDQYSSVFEGENIYEDFGSCTINHEC